MKKLFLLILIFTLVGNALVSSDSINPPTFMGGAGGEFVDSSADSLKTLDENHTVLDDDVLSFPATPTFGLMMFQMIGTLVILSVLLYFCLYFVKRLNAKFKNKNECASFKQHERIYFSTKQGLSAVSFGKKLYIISFSQNSVNLIDTIEDEETISKLSKENNSNQVKFSDFLKGFKKNTM